MVSSLTETIYQTPDLVEAKRARVFIPEVKELICQLDEAYCRPALSLMKLMWRYRECSFTGEELMFALNRKNVPVESCAEVIECLVQMKLIKVKLVRDFQVNSPIPFAPPQRQYTLNLDYCVPEAIEA